MKFVSASERADRILLSFIIIMRFGLWFILYDSACLGPVPIFSSFFFSFLFPVHTASERFVTGCSRNITRFRKGLFWTLPPTFVKSCSDLAPERWGGIELI